MKKFDMNWEKFAKLLYTDGPILHFTHYADADGISCEGLFKAFAPCFNNYGKNFILSHTVRIGYNNTVQIITGELEKINNESTLIVITDISANDELVDFICKTKYSIIYIDHHQCKDDLYDKLADASHDENKLITVIPWDNAAELSYIYEPKDFSIYDRKVSAAYILWIYFHRFMIEQHQYHYCDNNFEAFNDIMILISDADTYEWKKKNIGTKSNPKYGGNKCWTYIPDAFSLLFKYEGADEYIKSFRNFIDVVYHGTDMNGKDNVMDRIQLYDSIRRKNYEYWKKSLHIVTDERYQDFGKMNLTFVSDKDFSIFSAWRFEEDPELDTIVLIYPDTKTLEARASDSSNVDLSCVCRALGGGGHAKAAGAHLTNEQVIELLKTYWESKSVDSEK